MTLAEFEKLLDERWFPRGIAFRQRVLDAYATKCAELAKSQQLLAEAIELHEKWAAYAAKCAEADTVSTLKDAVVEILSRRFDAAIGEGVWEIRAKFAADEIIALVARHFKAS